MQEKTILRLSIFISLLGILILYLFSTNLDLKKVETIDQLPAEETVKLIGTIDRITPAEKVTFLEISNQKTEQTSVLIFQNSLLNLKEGDYVEITGTVEDYQGQKEIIANNILKK